jgi:hypothetical protein
MAYTGPTVAATFDDLLDDMRAWAETNAGFVDEGRITYSANESDLHVLSKSGIYYAFWAVDTSISNYGQIYFLRMKMMHVMPTTSNLALTTTGQRIYTLCPFFKNNGPFTGYYFFTDGTNMHVVVENTPSVFATFSFGIITKSWSFTGGHYITAAGTDYAASGPLFQTTYLSPIFGGGGQSRSSILSAVYFPINSLGTQADYAHIYSNVYDSQRARMVMPRFFSTNWSTNISDSPIGPLLYIGPQGYNNRVNFVPIYVTVWEPITSSWLLIGHIPNIAAVRIDNLSPGEIINVDWQVFPQIAKFGDSSAVLVTENLGIAIKRIA